MNEVMTQERTLEYALLLEQTQKNTILQIVLRVQVQDHNMAQSVCLLCLEPEIRSQSNTSYHLECTGKVDI